MGTRMEEALHSMDLSLLADRCRNELNKHRHKEPADDGFCLEIFRRAIAQRVDQAWSVLQQRFGEIVRIWLHSHPGSDVALQRDSEENYVAQTFSRFWYAVRSQRVEFQTLNAALSYLHATLNGILTDTLRSQLRSKNIVPLPDPGFPEEPAVEESHDSSETWEIISGLLADDRERRVAYLLYYCGLKPREIVLRCPDEFVDVKEVYRLNCNIVERLRRNRDRLRWLLGDREG
jgi:proteasome lid subunit RPN8/RPN11